MVTYRNIDEILDDAKNGVINVGKYTNAPMIFDFIPKIGEYVSIQPLDFEMMRVEIMWISKDKDTFRGKVINGYYPRNKNEECFIIEGEMIEFSRKKIVSIYHDR